LSTGGVRLVPARDSTAPFGTTAVGDAVDAGTTAVGDGDFSDAQLLVFGEDGDGDRIGSGGDVGDVAYDDDDGASAEALSDAGVPAGDTISTTDEVGDTISTTDEADDPTSTTEAASAEAAVEAAFAAATGQSGETMSDILAATGPLPTAPLAAETEDATAADPSAGAAGVAGGECVDLEGWVSTTGVTCQDYDANDWCVHGGGYGVGWDRDALGSFQDWGSDAGVDATQACCACMPILAASGAAGGGGSGGGDGSGAEGDIAGGSVSGAVGEGAAEDNADSASPVTSGGGVALSGEGAWNQVAVDGEQMLEKIRAGAR
jgi:hypothetical protein